MKTIHFKNGTTLEITNEQYLDVAYFMGLYSEINKIPILQNIRQSTDAVMTINLAEVLYIK